MMDIKSRATGVKGETVCITCTLVTLALMFAGSIILVITLHYHNANHSNRGIAVKEIIADNENSPHVKDTEEEMKMGQHDDDLSEGIREQWKDEQEMKDDSADVDYGKGYLSKRLLRWKHGEYRGKTVYTPGEAAAAYHRQQLVNNKLLGLLVRIIAKEDNSDKSSGEDTDARHLLLRLIDIIRHRQALAEGMTTPNITINNPSSITSTSVREDTTTITNITNEKRQDRYGEVLLDHVEHPQHDIPHETSFEVPHEIHESAKLTDDWLNLIEHEEGTMHIADELRKNQMLHGGSSAVAAAHHGSRAQAEPHSDLHELHKREITTHQIHKDEELHPGGEPVYNYLHHTEAHGHPPAEISHQYKTPIHKDHPTKHLTDDVDGDLEPLRRSNSESHNAIDHADEIQEERKSLPAYYNTPEFVLGIKPQYNPHPQAPVRFGQGVILPPETGAKDLHHEEFHEPQGHSEPDLHNELHIDSEESHQIHQPDEHECENDHHGEEVPDEHLTEQQKKSSLPEFTSNRDTMLLQLEEEETVLKEKIAHLPEDIDKKVHYKHRKDEHFTDKNAFHHDTNKPDVPQDKGYHDAMFQAMYTEDLGRLHDKLDHIQSEEAHLREDINAKHHVRPPIDKHITTTDHPNKMKGNMVTATKQPTTKRSATLGYVFGEPHVTISKQEETNPSQDNEKFEDQHQGQESQMSNQDNPSEILPINTKLKKTSKNVASTEPLSQVMLSTSKPRGDGTELKQNGTKVKDEDNKQGKRHHHESQHKSHSDHDEADEEKRHIGNTEAGNEDHHMGYDHSSLNAKYFPAREVHDLAYGHDNMNEQDGSHIEHHSDVKLLYERLHSEGEDGKEHHEGALLVQDEIDEADHDEQKRTDLHVMSEGLDHPALKDKHDSHHSNHKEHATGESRYRLESEGDHYNDEYSTDEVYVRSHGRPYYKNHRHEHVTGEDESHHKREPEDLHYQPSHVHMESSEAHNDDMSDAYQSIQHDDDSQDLLKRSHVDHEVDSCETVTDSWTHEVVNADSHDDALEKRSEKMNSLAQGDLENIYEHNSYSRSEDPRKNGKDKVDNDQKQKGKLPTEKNTKTADERHGHSGYKKEFWDTGPPHDVEQQLESENFDINKKDHEVYADEADEFHDHTEYKRNQFEHLLKRQSPQKRWHESNHGQHEPWDEEKRSDIGHDDSYDYGEDYNWGRYENLGHSNSHHYNHDGADVEEHFIEDKKRTNEHDEIFDVRGYQGQKHPETAEHYDHDAGLHGDSRYVGHFENLRDDESFDNHQVKRQHDDSIPLVNKGSLHQHMDIDDIHTQQYHTDKFKAPIDEDAFIQLWSTKKMKKSFQDNHNKDIPVERPVYKDMHYVHNDGESEINAKDTHHMSVEKKRSEEARWTHLGDYGHDPLAYKHMVDITPSGEDSHLSGGEEPHEELIQDPHSGSWALVNKLIKRHHGEHRAEKDGKRNDEWDGSWNHHEYSGPYHSLNDISVHDEQIEYHEWPEDKRGHHKDTTVNHHETGEMGSEAFHHSKHLDGNLESVESRKLHHGQASNHNDPHELKRGQHNFIDEYPEYKRAYHDPNVYYDDYREDEGWSGHVLEEKHLSSFDPVAYDYIEKRLNDDEYQAQLFPHGNPALLGRHGAGMRHKRHIIIGKEDVSPIDIADHPFNNHEFLEKKSQKDASYPNSHIELMAGDSTHNLETIHKTNEFNENRIYLEKIGRNDHRANLMEKAGSHDRKWWIQSEHTSPEDRSWNKDNELHELVTTEGVATESTTVTMGEKRSHLHGQPDWEHTHDWIDHGAASNSGGVVEPVIEDDNVFEAMQDDGDDIRHYDDQMNEIEYSHNSVYHPPSIVVDHEPDSPGKRFHYDKGKTVVVKELHSYVEDAEHYHHQPEEKRTMDDKELHHGIHGDADPHKWNVNRMLDLYKDDHQAEHRIHIPDEAAYEHAEERDFVNHDKSHWLESPRIYGGDEKHVAISNHEPHREHHNHTTSAANQHSTTQHDKQDDDWINAVDMSEDNKIDEVSDNMDLTKKHYNYDTGNEKHGHHERLSDDRTHDKRRNDYEYTKRNQHSGHHSHWEHGDDKREEDNSYIEEVDMRHHQDDHMEHGHHLHSNEDQTRRHDSHEEQLSVHEKGSAHRYEEKEAAEHDNKKDQQEMKHHKGDQNRRSHHEDNKFAVVGDVHTEDHHPRGEVDSDLLRQNDINQHERHNDIHNMDSDEVSVEYGDHHDHLYGNITASSPSSDEGINGYHTENFFRRFLHHGHKSSDHLNSIGDDVLKRSRDHFSHENAEHSQVVPHDGLHRLDPYPESAGFEVDPGFEAGEAIEGHEIEYHKPLSVLHIPSDAIEHHDEHNEDPLDVAIDRGDLEKDLNPQLLYPHMDNEMSHTAKEQNIPQITDVNMAVLEHDTSHRSDGENGEQEFHEVLHKVTEDDEPAIPPSYHQVHSDSSSRLDNPDHLVKQQHDNSIPHGAEHNGKVILVYNNGNHVESYDTDEDLKDAPSPFNKDVNRLAMQDIIQQADDLAKDTNHIPIDQSHDTPTEKPYHGEIHKFDPDLYAKLGYWPYDHIDGDARQLYYAQWLNRHPVHHETEPNHHMTGEEIRKVLAERLHRHSRKEKTHHSLEEDAHKVYLDSEFLKRHGDRGNDQHMESGNHKHHKEDKKEFHFEDDLTWNEPYSNLETRKYHPADDGDEYIEFDLVKRGDHQGIHHPEPREHDSNHFVDVSDSHQGASRKHKSHSDGNHHQPIDEEEDTISDPVEFDLTPEEVDELFTGEASQHKQYDPDVYGDIHEFKTFYSKRLHDNLDDISRRFGDNIWDTELPDDDDPNLHVHTHLMNNYNPAEHTSRVQLRDYLHRPFIQADDDLENVLTDHRFTDADLHNEDKEESANLNSPDILISDPVDISTEAEEMHQGGKRGHIHNNHEGLGNVFHWDNKRHHIPHDATHDGMEHMDVDESHYIMEKKHEDSKEKDELKHVEVHPDKHMEQHYSHPGESLQVEVTYKSAADPIETQELLRSLGSYHRHNEHDDTEALTHANYLLSERSEPAGNKDGYNSYLMTDHLAGDRHSDVKHDDDSDQPELETHHTKLVEQLEAHDELVNHLQHFEKQPSITNGIKLDKEKESEFGFNHHENITESAADDEAVAKTADEILKVIKEYNEKQTVVHTTSTSSSFTTSAGRSTERTVSADNPGVDQGIEKWLDEILEITNESEVLKAALDLYAQERKGNEHKTASSEEDNEEKQDYFHMLQLMAVMKGDRAHEKLITSKHPTLHMKGHRMFMTYKRQQKEQNDTSGLELNNTNIILDGMLTPDEFNELYPPTDAASPIETPDSGMEEYDEIMEKNLLRFLLENASLTIQKSEAAKSLLSRNLSVIDQFLEKKVPMNWLIIGICVTFTMTCLCVLTIALAICLSNRRRFSADTWWSSVKGEEDKWLGDDSFGDIEGGGNDKLKALYSLEGDELKKQVSILVNGAVSSSQSLVSDTGK